MMFLLLLILHLTVDTSVAPKPPAGSWCMYNGKKYEDGEEIDRSPDSCFGLKCKKGSLESWQGKCSFYTSTPCYGKLVRVPGKCCPECLDPTTTPPTGCDVNGTIYDFGSDIPQKDPCRTCTCTKDSGVLCALASCEPVMCVNPRKKRNQCCPLCPNGPNCWYKRLKIKVGDTYRPKPNIECSCPEPYHPFACCKTICQSKKFLEKQLDKQKGIMNPILKEYIMNYLGM